MFRRKLFRLNQLISLVFIGFVTIVPAQKSNVIALVGGTVIDGTGAVAKSDMTVLIKNGRISEIGASNSIVVPKGAKRLDVSGKTILPGFIDLHNHVMYPPIPMSSLGANELIKARTLNLARNPTADNSSLSTLRALHFMTLNMRAGITALRDTGSTVETGQALMQAKTLGYTNAARLYSVGNVIAMTGGHNAYFSPKKGSLGPWGFRESVRKNYAAGFGHIKISPPYTKEEIEAAVDEGKKLGLKVTAHAGYLPDSDPPELVRMAIEAGVESLEHPGNPLRDETLDLMVKHNVKLIPTLSIYRALIEYKIRNYEPDRMKKLENVVRKAHEKGIIIGVGTDFVGNWLDEKTPGGFFIEMNYYKEIGMTPMEVIVAATKNGGIILGMEKDLGTLEKGKIADLQVVDGNPLESFDVLGKPEIVMIDGEIKFKR